MTLKHLGCTAKEIGCLTYKDYTSPEEDSRMSNMFSEMYRTGRPLKFIDHEVIHRDGEVRVLEATVSVIRDKAGRPVGARGVARDVTERKKLREQLLQAQKVEAIGTLAGGIAHDFNNLLMGIQGYTSLLLLDMETGSPLYEKLKAIESQVQSGADLTRQLLGYARGGRYAIKPTDMNGLIEKTAAMFGRTRKEITIQRRYAEDLQSVEVDRGQIEQVLLNLFLNAWQAMPGGGSLSLETQNVTLTDDFTGLHDTLPGPYVKVSITDTGTGMDEKTRQRIFDPFFTTKEMGRGVGLGLASSYGIVRGHQGIITVYSERGHGSTFNIYLPASKEAVPQEAERSRIMTRGRETVLIVDDEAIIRDVTQAILDNLGYEVLMAKNGIEAMEIYQAHRGRIAVVIMDMIMPGMGGGEVFDRIRALDPGVRVILSSGYSLNGEAKDIMNRGCRAFLQKPFQFDELSQKLREVIEG